MIEEKSAMTVVGIECRTSNHPGAAPIDIPRLWERFYREGVLERIPNKITDSVIALYCDYEGDYTLPYTCVIGAEVSSIGLLPKGMVAKEVPAGPFVQILPEGDPPKSIIEAWQKIWRSDLPRSYTGDYELYQKEGIAIYIALKR